MTLYKCHQNTSSTSSCDAPHKDFGCRRTSTSTVYYGLRVRATQVGEGVLGLQTCGTRHNATCRMVHVVLSCILVPGTRYLQQTEVLYFSQCLVTQVQIKYQPKSIQFYQ